MKKQILTLFLIFNLLPLFNGCKCPDEKYFDYKSLKIIADTYISSSNRLAISVKFTDIYYLVQKSPTLNLGFCAYAKSVCEQGYKGEKYPITHIFVSSNSDFDNNHIAGSELNDLIKVYGTNSEGLYILGYLKDFEISKINPSYMFIESRPEIDKKHIFTVKFKKSNGDIVSGVSEEVTWE